MPFEAGSLGVGAVRHDKQNLLAEYAGPSSFKSRGQSATNRVPSLALMRARQSKDVFFINDTENRGFDWARSRPAATLTRPMIEWTVHWTS